MSKKNFNLFQTIVFAALAVAALLNLVGGATALALLISDF